MSKGGAVGDGLLGTPLTSTTYTLCVYDTTTGVPSKVMTLNVPPNGAWEEKTGSVKYKDKSGVIGGVTLVQAKAGSEGKSSISFQGSGPSLFLPGAVGPDRYFTQDTSVIVQAGNSSGQCWTSEFTALDTKKNEAAKFQAKTK